MKSTLSIFVVALYVACSSGLDLTVVKSKFNVSVECQGVYAQVAYWQVAMDPDGIYELALQISANSQCKECMGGYNSTNSLVDKCKPCLTALKPYLIEWRRRGCVDCFGLNDAESCFQCTVNVVSSGLEQFCAIKYNVREHMSILHNYIFARQ